MKADAIGESSPALDRLAEHLGIAPAFDDARGERQNTSAETKRRLLAAMGISAADEQAASDSLTQHERAMWDRALPAVCVVHRDTEAQTVQLVLPADHGELRVRIVLESGEIVRRGAAFGTLPLSERRTLGGQVLEKRRFPIDAAIPMGYHRLELESAAGATMLIVSPGRCWLPPELASGGRAWGIALQLYSLCSARQWGIGDYGDLRRVVSLIADRGGALVGLNPLHALFPDDPASISPYAPASRLLLNILNIDVTAIAEWPHCQQAQQRFADPQFQERLERCRSATHVDYAGVTALKLPILRMLFEAFQDAATEERRAQFKAFRSSWSERHEQACLFLALREHFVQQDRTLRDWQRWPAEFRDAGSRAVAQFADQHAGRIDELAWFQWIADGQLAEASKAGEHMKVGLYGDLAVGAHPDGAESWSNPRAVVSGARIGAPPDLYNPAGQDWGLPPLHPLGLRAECYRSFIELLRANMRHCGALRIDHAMALQRLYWIPKGSTAAEGTYVSYPLEDLLGILALESERNQCLIVGEDLGTVPEGFRERMARANVLSYRVLYFEQEGSGGDFIPPMGYPRLALAVAASHDLPTLRAWWEGTDIALRNRLHLFPDANEVHRAREQRAVEVTKLRKALTREGVLAVQEGQDAECLRNAVHEFLGRSNAMLASAQIDDITGETEPVNVPGTTDEYPNWRRRLHVSVEELPTHPGFIAVALALAATRG